MAPWGPEGAAGPEIPFPMPGERPPTLTVRVTDAIPGYSPGAMIGRPVPFWPLAVAAMANDTSVIHGTAEQYRFSIQRPDGLALEVTRLVEPIVVGEEEAAWHAARVRAHLSQADAAWEWDAPPVPEHKPAYTAFLPTTSGETWVLRQGPGYRATNCAVDIPAWDAPESCWESEQIVDAFAPDGRYLGAVRVPENLLFDPRPVIDGDTVVGVVRNDAGTLRVKRYRVSIPDREQ